MLLAPNAGADKQSFHAHVSLRAKLDHTICCG